jgi:hypothetical protein
MVTEALRSVRFEPIARSVARPSARVVLALARIEVRHLLRHPTFLGPMAFAAVYGAIAAARAPIAGAIVLWGGLVAATLLSADVQALRARRDGMQELFASLPSPASTRTAAQLSSIVLGPVAIAALVPIVAFAAKDLAPASPPGRAFTPGLLGYFVAYLPFVVFVMGSLGFALGRWIPSPVAGPLAVVAHVTTPLLVLLIPWLYVDPDVEGSAQTVGWNFGYLLGLATLWTSLAFVRDCRRPASLVFAGTGLGLAVAGAFLQGPLPGGYL